MEPQVMHYDIEFQHFAAGFLSSQALSWLTREPLVCRALAILISGILVYGSWIHEPGLVAMFESGLERLQSHMATGHFAGFMASSGIIHMTRVISGQRSHQRLRRRRRDK